jgi:hypothetical protein
VAAALGILALPVVSCVLEPGSPIPNGFLSAFSFGFSVQSYTRPACYHFSGREEEYLEQQMPILTVKNVLSNMTHPFSIYIWQPARHPVDTGQWIEPVQVYMLEYAIYLANLIHQDSRAVIKVVRYGLTLACFPNEHTVALVEQQIVKQGLSKH